jgi:hypothetical protein
MAKEINLSAQSEYSEASSGGLIASGYHENNNPENVFIFSGGSSDVSIIYNGDLEDLICLRQTPTTTGPSVIANNVEIKNVNGENVYVFGEEFGKYGLAIGTYIFNIPESHPIAFLNVGRLRVNYIGTNFKGNKTALDGNKYDFFWGRVTLTITANIGTSPLSYQSYDDGYLGGLNNLVYSTSCLGPNTDVVLGGDAIVRRITRFIVPDNLFFATGEAGVGVQRDVLVTGGISLGGSAIRLNQFIVDGYGLKAGGLSDVVGRLSNPIKNFANTASNLPTGVSGAISWNNLNGALSPNDLQTAIVTFNSSVGSSTFLYLSNFKLEIPEFGVVLGISLKVKKYAPTGEVSDSFIGLVWSNNGIKEIVPTNKKLNGNWTSSSVLPPYEYGGNTDTWGKTWNYNEVNHEDFGVVLEVLGDPALNSVGLVDYAEISVFYTQNIFEFGSGGLVLNGDAENKRTNNVSVDVSKSLIASGLSLVSYPTFEPTNGISLSGSAVLDLEVSTGSGNLILGGSAVDGRVLNGNWQNISLLRPSLDPNDPVINEVRVRPTGIDGQLEYVFNNDRESNFYGLQSGTYILNVPESYPIAFLNRQFQNRLVYNAPNGFRIFRSVSDPPQNGLSTLFVYGQVTLTIASINSTNTNFSSNGPLSYRSLDNGFLGGERKLVWVSGSAKNNTDTVLGGTSNVGMFDNEVSSGGSSISGSAVEQLIYNSEITGGATTSGESEKSLSVGMSGGCFVSPQGENLKSHNVAIDPFGLSASGLLDIKLIYNQSISGSSIIGGNFVIGIQPYIEGGISLNGENKENIYFNTFSTKGVACKGFHSLTQFYGPPPITGFAKIGGKARSENLKPFLKRTTSYGYALASDNILKTQLIKKSKLIEFKEEQPQEVNNLRSQIDGGWCDVGDPCDFAYVPKIIKNRQKGIVPKKQPIRKMSRQIATLTTQQ